jgi:RNA polymerase sigma factor (sigma-70 family)
MYNYDKHNLEELFLLVKESDTGAFDILYHRTWKELYKSAYLKLKNKPLAKDIVQDVYIDLWNKREIKEIKNVEGYLYQAVRFKVIDQFRKKHNVFEEVENFIEAIGDVEFADSKCLEKELETLLDGWLEQLPKKRKEIFLLHYKEDKSTSEISDMLNISRKTVQNQLLTTTNMLKHLMHKILFIFFILFFGT